MSHIASNVPHVASYFLWQPGFVRACQGVPIACFFVRRGRTARRFFSASMVSLAFIRASLTRISDRPGRPAGRLFGCLLVDFRVLFRPRGYARHLPGQPGCPRWSRSRFLDDFGCLLGRLLGGLGAPWGLHVGIWAAKKSRRSGKKRLQEAIGVRERQKSRIRNAPDPHNVVKTW